MNALSVIPRSITSLATAGILMVASVSSAFATATQQDFRTDIAVDSDFGTAVRSFLNYFLGFLGLLSVLMIIYAGVLLVTSNGDQDNIDRGKRILLWAGIGIILIMLSYAIVRLLFGAADVAENSL